METPIKCPNCGCEYFLPQNVPNTEYPGTDTVAIHFRCENCGQSYDYFCDKDVAPVFNAEKGVMEYRDPSWMEEHPDLVEILEDEGVLKERYNDYMESDGGFDPDIG